MSLRQGTSSILPLFQVHFYQPMFTLVGGGLKKFTQTHTSTQDVLPKGCKWIKSKAIKFDPENNTVFTDHGEKVCLRKGLNAIVQSNRLLA